MLKRKKIKILIFGGTGFIGCHLTKKCINKGWDVTSVSKNYPKKEKFISKVKYKNINLENLKNFNVIEKNYDYLINASGYINNNKKLGYKEHNLKIVKNIFSHFKHSDIKTFLNIGTSAEYGGMNSPQSENLKCIPKSKYGKDKLNCSIFLIDAYKKFKFPSVIFRIYQVYGPLQETNRLIPIAAKACFFDKKFNCTDGNEIRDFIYIDDLVDAIFKALKNNQAKGKIFNLGSGKKISIKFIIIFIKKFYKKGYPIFGKIKLRKDESKIIFADIKKSKKILKWKPKITFKIGLLKTLRYYKNKYK
jgi:nucleoside-diphosphate-sugar epimerase